jgi:hypothetical protein
LGPYPPRRGDGWVSGDDISNPDEQSSWCDAKVGQCRDELFAGLLEALKPQ